MLDVNPFCIYMELKQFEKENTIILEFSHLKAFGRLNVHTTDVRDDRVSDEERNSEKKERIQPRKIESEGRNSVTVNRRATAI